MYPWDVGRALFMYRRVQPSPEAAFSACPYIIARLK